MKKYNYFKEYANLAFALSLLQQSTSLKERLEARDIMEQSEGAIKACPYFEFQSNKKTIFKLKFFLVRAIFVESFQVLYPVRALKEVELALALIEKNGKSG
jgi:hypothetical protein